MKGKFTVDSSLLTLKETLQNKEPYAVAVISTTGLDNKSFAEHSPTRVVLKQYEYDNNIKQYRESVTFDKLVKAPDAAVTAALENSDFDAFANGGIDKDSYIKGENVLDVSDFKKEFDTAVSAISGDNTTLIINGTVNFAKTYLDKIGCFEGIEKMRKSNKVLEQTALTKEYFGKVYAEFPELSPKNGLEDLRYTLSSSNPVLTRAAGTMAAEDFNEKYPKADYTKFKNEHDSILARGGAIIGGDNRIAVINNFVTKYGWSEKVLPEKYISDQLEANASYIQELSEKGKEKYRESSIDEKFRVLIEKKAIDPDKIMGGKSEFNKLIDAIESKENKGLIFIHAASTGFDFSKPLPQKTGFPIQFTAAAYIRQPDGTLSFEQKPKGMSINIKAPDKDIILAEKNIAAPKPYDTFKETGINLEEYKKGINVTSEEDARVLINKYFTKFSPKDYAVITLGGTSGSDLSFTQNCLANLGNFPVNDAPHIDMMQAVKDYAYLSVHDEAYNHNNVLFDTDKIQNFSLQSIANIRESDGKPVNLNSTTLKCAFAARLAEQLEQQQKELFHPEELSKANKTNETDKEQQTAPVTDNSVSNVQKQPNSKAQIADNSTEEQTNRAVSSVQSSEKPVFRRENFSTARQGRTNIRRDDITKQSETRQTEVEKRNDLWRKAVSERNTGSELFNANERIVDKDHSTEAIFQTRIAEMKSVQNDQQLLSVIAMQSQTIAEQSKLISELNSKLIDTTREYIAAQQKQNNKMMEMVATLVSLQSFPETERNIKQPTMSRLTQLDDIMDAINIQKNAADSAKAKALLISANRALVDAQKEMDYNVDESLRQRVAE